MIDTNNIIEIDMSTEARSRYKSAFYQYDKSLMVRLINVPELGDCTLWVEMCNSGDAVIKNTVQYTGEDVEIPEALLLNGHDIEIYIFVKGEDWGKTILTIYVKIDRRPSIENGPS